MKYLCSFIFALVGIVAVIEAKSCETFMDCGINECCKDFGLTKRCLDLRDDGQTCGGKFLCDCKIGYMCKEREESVWNAFKIGTGTCTSLANTANFREW